MKTEKDFIPPIALYSKYLNIASFKFNLTMNECRNRFGLFTVKQWEELFSN